MIRAIAAKYENNAFLVRLLFIVANYTLDALHLTLVTWGGLITASYLLFGWEMGLLPIVRGMIFGVAATAQFAMACLDKELWSGDVLKVGTFLARMPWSLAGGVGLPFLFMTSINTTDMGLVDTGLGYAIHPLSFAIAPLVVVGLMVGNRLGMALADWGAPPYNSRAAG